MIRDLTEAQFKTRCRESGFVPEGFMGYYRLPIPGHHLCVSIFNAGERRRDQLAYLHQRLASEAKCAD